MIAVIYDGKIRYFRDCEKIIYGEAYMTDHGLVFEAETQSRQLDTSYSTRYKFAPVGYPSGYGESINYYGRSIKVLIDGYLAYHHEIQPMKKRRKWLMSLLWNRPNGQNIG